MEINLTDPELYATGDPFAVWRWLRANDPVRWQPPSGLPGFWILTRYHDVRAVYGDPVTFSSARGILLRPRSHGSDPGGGQTLALTDPPQHRQLRAVVESWFTLRSVRSLETEIRNAAREVVIRAMELGSCDFVTEVAARIPLYVICTLMGVPRADWESLFALTYEAFCSDDALERRFAHLEILQYFRELVVHRTKCPGDDIVSAFVNARPGDRELSLDELVLNCDNLLVGGTENTRLAAAGGMLAFLQNPAEWRALSRDRALLRPAVEEVLRWTSSATHIMRTATRPVEICQRQIKDGDRVTLWNPSANRDEAVFGEPDRFSFRREPNRHLALGAGEHFCLGSVLARAELRLLYDELLRNAENIELDGVPVRLSSFVVNGLRRLPVRFLPKRVR